jgi:hypothetical protein
MQNSMQVKLAELRQETDAIHFATKMYWEIKHPSYAAVVEYERRRVRLEQIRLEMEAIMQGIIANDISEPVYS